MPETLVSENSFDSTDLLALPVMPAVLGKLLETCDDETVSIQKLVRLVGADATLSARMLAVANSAAYRHRTPRAPNLEARLRHSVREPSGPSPQPPALYQSCSQRPGIPASVLNISGGIPCSAPASPASLPASLIILIPRKPIWAACCTILASW